MSSNITTVGWTPEGGGRGTWSILWSCWSTFILATWITWHGPAFAARPKWRFMIERPVITIASFLAPEVCLVFAIQDFIGSYRFRGRIQALGINCSWAQAQYVGIGGYTVIVPSEIDIAVNSSKEADEVITRPSGLRALNQDQILWLVEKKLVSWPGKDGLSAIEILAASAIHTSSKDKKYQARPRVSQKNDEVSQDRMTSMAVDVADNRAKITESARYITDSPRLLNTPEIQERSNSDGFAKAIVIFKCLWFILNCILRGVHGLPLAPLEILVLSCLACTFFSYVLWWQKPYNVSVCTRLDLALSASDWESLRLLSPSKQWEYSAFYEQLGGTHLDDPQIPIAFEWPAYLFLLSGAIHFIAWNSLFPTPIEKLLWQISAVILVITPLFLGGDQAMIPREKRLQRILWAKMEFVIFGLLLLAKLYVFAESLAAFRALPSNVYDTYEVSNYLFSFI